MSEREYDAELDEIPFREFHDMLVERGNEIGYYNALLEYVEKDYITEERAYKLKDTIFADALHNELDKKGRFRKVGKIEIAEYFRFLLSESRCPVCDELLKQEDDIYICQNKKCRRKYNLVGKVFELIK